MEDPKSYLDEEGLAYYTQGIKKLIDEAEPDSITEEQIDEIIALEQVEEMQLVPLFANSVEELNENGDTTKLYVLPDGYIYAYMKTEESGGTSTGYAWANTGHAFVPANGGNTGNGNDGFSPIATVTQTDSGAVISITDANSTTTATITNGKDGAPGADGSPGADGYTPVRGTDYWTDDDKQEIVNSVLASLPSAEEVAF